MIEVYYAPPSIYGRKVLTVLDEKGLDYTIKRMSFASGDHKKEDYLKINPNGEIPTLIDDDGEALYESTAIIEYLNDEYPHPPLMPEDSLSRAKVRMIDDYCDLHLYCAVVNYLLKKRGKEEILEEDLVRLRTGLERIEKHLGDKKFLVGEFSLADCAFMPVVASLGPLGLGELLKRSQPFNDYVATLQKRASFKAASKLSLEDL